jgi:RNA polymerase-binding transcription factor DksA
VTIENESVVNIEALLNEVDVAMRRLADGDYQLCAVCRAPIDRDRLIDNPLLTTCVQHPQLNESDDHE